MGMRGLVCAVCGWFAMACMGDGEMDVDLKGRCTCVLTPGMGNGLSGEKFLPVFLFHSSCF